jgi:uncharacterized protein YraI
MPVRSLLTAAVFAAAAAIPAVANAAYITNDLHLRTGPGTGYPSILVMPAGAPVQVYRCPNWCELNFNGYIGWASPSYIAGAGYGPYPAQPIYRPPPPVYGPAFPPPPPYGYVRRPWWDTRYGAWYDGNRWYYQGRWYDRPGFSLYFNFGN